MKVKEAIDTLEDFISDFAAEGNNNMVKEFEQIIALLQQGEVYEQMWEELYQEYGICPIRKVDEEGYMSNILYKILEELEQKYFPKEAKTKNET